MRSGQGTGVSICDKNNNLQIFNLIHKTCGLLYKLNNSCLLSQKISILDSDCKWKFSRTRIEERFLQIYARRARQYGLPKR